MPGSDETIRILDLPANKADIAELINEIKKLDTAMEGISGVNLFGKTGNAAEARQQQAQMTAGLEQIAELQRRLIDLENQLAEARKKSSGGSKAKTDEEIRAQIEAAEASRKNVAAIKDKIKWDEAEADSMVRKRIELKQIKAEYIKLGPEKQAMESGQAMVKQMRELSDELLRLESGYGQFGRNVGNYANALKPLEEEFKKVSESMTAMQQKAQTTVQNLGARNPVGFSTSQWQQQNTTAFTTASGQMVNVLNSDAEAFGKAAEQAGWLNTIIQRNKEGFSSFTQQARYNERAIISLKEAGLGGTEALEQFKEKTIEAGREMREQQRQLKLLTSELPALKALTLAAKGLGGAYAIGAGAQALFADGNEKVEKEMAKLVAIMTVLQGLGEAWELIQMRGAAAAAFHEAATVGLTGAIEGYEAVVDGAIAATTSLDAAMMATGIGALVVALGGLIYLITHATESTEEYIEAQKKLNEQLEHYYDAIIKVNQSLDEELKKDDEVAKKALEVFTINVRTGKAQDELAVKKKAIAEQDIKTADAVAEKLQKELQITGKLTDAQDDLQGAYDEQMSAAKASLELQKEYAEKLEQYKTYVGPHGEGPDPRIKEELEGNIKREQGYIDLYQKQAGAIKVKLDRVKEVTKAQEDGAQALKVLDAEEQKRQFENNEIRLAAIDGFRHRTQQRMAEYLAMQSQIGVSEEQRLRALQAEKAVRDKMLQDDINQQLHAAGQLERKDSELTEAEKAKKKDIIDSYNEKFEAIDIEFMGRQAALRKEYADRDINEANFTNAELLKKREEYYKQQETLANQHAANQKAAAETDRDQRLKALDEQQARSHPEKQGPLGAQAYADQRLRIETEANNKSLEADKELTRKQIALAQQKEDELKRQPSRSPEEAKKQLEDIAALEAQKNALTAKYTGLDKQQQLNTHNLEMTLDKEKLERKKELASQEVQLARNVEEAVSTFIKGSYQAEEQRIQRQIQLNERLKEAESSRIQNSTLQETAKQAYMVRLQAETDQKNQALERKMRQTKIKEAEFDRDKAILDITATTAAAVAKDIGIATALAANPITAPLAPNAYIQAAIAGAIGAAQIAIVLARPLPKFEAGTDFSPEGLAILHPGEMRVDPSGKISMTPDAPESLAYLERGTKIIPRHRRDEMNDMLLASIFSDNRPAPDNRLHERIDDLKNAVIQTGRDQLAAIKKQKPAQTHVYVDANFLTYIKTCQ